MVPPAPAPTPTTRFLKAAEAEREQLAEHRQQLLQTREALRAELERLESSLRAVDERESLLDRLVGPAALAYSSSRPEPLARRTADDEEEARPVLRGPDIRRESVRVLLAHADRPEALHYRAWFELLEEAGFSVAGKDPLATFLTQLSRSPAVRKSTESGVYELDRGAAQRLRRRVDDLHDELRRLTGRQSGNAAAVRALRSELNAELGRVEKALDEVEALFEDDIVEATLTPLRAAG